MNWKDAFERQMETWQLLRSPFGRRMLQGWMDAECQGQPTKRAVYEQLIPAEERKLLLADPIYVSNDMIDLIEFARQSWIIEPFVGQDIIVPHAFIYLARSMYLLDRNGREVNVRAISYAPCRSDDGTTDGVALSLYSCFEDDGRDTTIVDIREYAEQHGQALPHLTLLHMAPVWFDVDPELEMQDYDIPTERTGAEQWWSFVQVLLRMMTQTVTVRDRYALDRHSRRRGLRAKFEPREVTVVKLRRPRHQPTDHEVDVEWSHRWIVTGHWRNQFYPTLGLHRQIWISPYVKGPDDAPLVVKHRAYEWTR